MSPLGMCISLSKCGRFGFKACGISNMVGECARFASIVASSGSHGMYRLASGRMF